MNSNNMKTINKYLNEALITKDTKLKDRKNYVPTQGNHDKSIVYDDIWNDIKDHLERWGAGPVYGWNGKNGVAFSVSEGENVEKDDWIVIQYNRGYDDFSIFLAKYGNIDDEDNIKNQVDMIYSGQEPEVIDELLGIK